MSLLLFLVACTPESSGPYASYAKMEVRECGIRPKAPPPPPEKSWGETLSEMFFSKEEPVPTAAPSARRDTGGPVPKPATKTSTPIPKRAMKDEGNLGSKPDEGIGGLIGGRGTGLGGGGSAEGLGGLGSHGLGSRSGYGAGGKDFAKGPLPPPPSEASQPAPAPLTVAAPAVVSEGQVAPDPAAPAIAEVPVVPEVVAEAAPKKKKVTPPTPPPPPPQPEPDWGAEIHLSNDDSMSLASAQRLLWAADSGAQIDASQVRPHEFLNYFHFRTSEIESGHLFSIKASALADTANKLTFAFAVAGAKPERQPLDLTLVLDRSGSMSAEGRMEYLKRGLHLMEKSLQTGDRVDLVLFDSESCAPLENYVVGRDDPNVLTETIDLVRPHSGTNIGKGLAQAYQIATQHTEADRNHRVMLITDALVNEGELDPNIIAQVGKGFDESGIRLTGIGVGREFSDVVLDKLTEAGKGPYLYLGSEAVVDRFFGDGFESMVRTLAHDVRFSVDLPDSLAQERFYGEESSTDERKVQPIDYQSGNTQLFMQDLLVRGGTPVYTDPVVFLVRWKDPKSGVEQQERLETTVGAMLGESAVNIQKARALMAWADMANARANRAEACAAPYSNFQKRMEGIEDAEMVWLNEMSTKLCSINGTWQGAQYGLSSYRPSNNVSIGTPVISGAMPEMLIVTVARRNQSAIRYCYQRELVKNPTIAGQAKVRFVINTDGMVSQAQVQSSALPSSVNSCIEGRFLRMAFPSPPSSVTVTLPLSFSP